MDCNTYIYCINYMYESFYIHSQLTKLNVDLKILSNYFIIVLNVYAPLKAFDW